MAAPAGQILDALGDPTRRLIFQRLARGPLPVNEIAAGLPVSRPAVSQHLKVLKRAGLVVDRAEGTRRIYQSNAAALQAIRDYLDRFRDRSPAASREVAEREAPRARTVITPDPEWVD